MIKKELIKKILSLENITQEELNTFIVEYVYLMKNRDVSSQELTKIVLLVQNGAFNIVFAAEQAGIKLGYNITKLYDKNGYLLNVTIL